LILRDKISFNIYNFTVTVLPIAVTITNLGPPVFKENIPNPLVLIAGAPEVTYSLPDIFDPDND